MAFFGFGKGKDDGPALELVLAYLEDAFRKRSPFTLVADQGRETSALLHSVNEDARSLRLLPKADLAPAKGSRLAFTCIHDGLRIGGSAKVLEARSGTLTLQLPPALELMERRGAPRARVNPKELATMTALQDLFSGVGITGGLENIGPGGARVRVDKAMAIGSEKLLVLGTNLVPTGQSFTVIKLGKVPRCPVAMEAAGKAVYLAYDAAGLAMGFAFGKLSGPVEGSLRALVSLRCPPQPAGLPPKARRQPGPDPEEEEAENLAGRPLTARKPKAARSGEVDERRHSPRLSLDEGFRASFMIEDVRVDQASLTDLSVGGCCLRLAMEHCRGLEKGVALQAFRLVHPDLPGDGLQGRVKWVLGRAAEAMGKPGPPYCLVGVAFEQVPEAAGQAIAAFVAGQLLGPG